MHLLPWYAAAGMLCFFALPDFAAARWLCAALCGLTVFCLLFRRYRYGTPAALMLVCFAFGTAYSLHATETALSRQVPADPPPHPTRAVFQVASAPEYRPDTVRFTATVRTEQGQHYRLSVSDRRQREWPPGSRWEMTVRIRPTIGAANENGFDLEAWALSRNIHGFVSAAAERTELPPADGIAVRWQQLRHRIQQRLHGVSADYPEGSALLNALATGGHGGLEDRHWHTFRRLGANHLVSISGLHIGMIALAAAWWARLLLRPLPLAEPRRWYLAVGMAAAFAYAALAGFGVPVQRSLIMLSVFTVNWWRRSGSSPWQSWITAMCAVLLLNPLSALSVGFWLSFGTVAALIWGSSGYLKAGKTILLLRAQTAAALGSFWAAAQAFGSVPLAAPLANLVLIPWFSWLLVPLVLAAAFIPFDPLLHLAAAACQYTLDGMTAAARYAPAAALPHLPAPLWLAVIAACAVLLMPRGFGLKPWALLVFAAALLYRSPAPAYGTAAVRIHDVGQGLSLQIRTRNHWLLFDTGTAAAAQTQLLPALSAQNLPPPDLLVLSHHDNDHDGGHTALTAILPPKQTAAGQPEFYADAVHCSGTGWTWDGVWFEWLTPDKTDSRAADNEHSCVLRVVAGGHALLVSGDLGMEGERALVRRYGRNLYSQILILGHHGSRYSTAAEWLDAAAPHSAVATNGFANRYGHPAERVRHSLSARNIALYTSARHGSMDILLGGGTPPQIRLRRPAIWQRKPFPPP